MSGHELLESLPLIFTEILPDNYHIFKYSENDTYLIYISDKELSSKEISTESVGYIEISIPSDIFVRDNKYDEKSGHIKFIKVNKPKFGIGSYLMILVCYFYNIYERKITIELDDDSDFSWKGSIYEKLGCKYVNEYPFPEMECDTKIVLNNYKDFYNKYKGNGFFIESDMVDSYLHLNNSDINKKKSPKSSIKKSSTKINIKKTIKKKTLKKGGKKTIKNKTLNKRRKKI